MMESPRVVTNNKASVIIDSQWGSTGKGLCAAFLASDAKNEVDFAATNAGPNAGHTTCYKNGRKFIAFHYPTTAVVQKGAMAFLNAGSIIDPKMLYAEIDELGMDPSKLIIHPRAAVVEDVDKLYENEENSAATKLSSTQKGVGRALSRKILREATLAGDHPKLKKFVNTDFNLASELNKGARAFVEVPQGFCLSLNDGNAYPFCTSRNISVSQALADAGLHPHHLAATIATLRYNPIRVGNIRNEEGKEIGFSGPCFSDQKELTWEELGQTPELTTVTKRVRRVFNWSNEQYAFALRTLAPDFIFANFFNYIKSKEDAEKWLLDMKVVEEATLGRTIPDECKMFGVGPCIEDVHTFGGARREMWS